MSEVKRLPDSDGWWWFRGCEKPEKIVMRCGEPLAFNAASGKWQGVSTGQWLPCSEPEWPPEPPPRPQMVFGSAVIINDRPATDRWWVRLDDNTWMSDGGCCTYTPCITPHDHPDQSAEESRRILEAEKNS